MSRLLASLNPEQADAVRTTKGPLLVLAGAGTGKTRVVTFRIAHLLQKRVPPEAILALTFTNKAAAEMRERVSSLVGSKRAAALTMGTFHGFCLKVLREHGKALGWTRPPTICDSADQLATMKTVLRELHVPEARERPYDLLSRISLLKSRLVTHPMLAEKPELDPGGQASEILVRAWARYQEALERSGRVDFDDLLTATVQLFAECPDVLEEYRERFRYVSVDEYQDTNLPQYEVVRRIAGKRANLCVVGDDDQSIYGWRGADVTRILSFERDFPGAKTVRLETNYRSTRDILNIANRLIVHNPARHDKSLKSAIGGGESVQSVLMKDELYEAEHIALEIQGRVKRQEARFSEHAILFRTAPQARVLESELRARDIPYVLVGGMSFFDRKEVRDVVAYLRLVANPLDEASLLRVLNAPPRGVGKTTLERVLAFATTTGVCVTEAFRRAEQIDGVKTETAAVVPRLLERLQAIGQRHAKDPVALVESVVEAVAYRAEVERNYPDDATRTRRWEGVTEVFNFAENYTRKHSRPTLAGFLDEITLCADDRGDEDPSKGRDVVTLMTLHASKGLEFPRVYLVGLEEGLLPHAKSLAGDGVEEERRLTYVGITRARQTLTLSYAVERARFGKRVTVHPSRFLFEIKGSPPPESWSAADAAPEPPAKKGRKGRRKKARPKTRR